MNGLICSNTKMFKKILVNYGEVLPYPVYLHRGEEEELLIPHHPSA